MKVITLTGKDGGKMAGTADIEIRVPHFGYADRIQEIHIKVIHILIQLIEKRWLSKSGVGRIRRLRRIRHCALMPDATLTRLIMPTICTRTVGRIMRSRHIRPENS